MTETNTFIDSSLCPLCGGANECARVAGSDMGCTSNKGECWCQNVDVVFPDTLLKQVPAKSVNKTCICRSCLRAHTTDK